MADTPAEDAPVIEIATWIGDRRDWHKGKLAGLQAEKQVHLDKLVKVYDAQINRHSRAIEFIDHQYYVDLFDLARKLIGDAKKRSIAVGMLILKLRKTRASVDVQDNDKAVVYLQQLVTDQETCICELETKAELARRDEDEDTYEACLSEISKETLALNQLVGCLNVKTSVAKAALPDSLKATLTSANLENIGMVFIPGGKETLAIE